MKASVRFLVPAVLAAIVSTEAGARVDGFRDCYFIGGGPTGSSWNSVSADLKFEFSFKVQPLELGNGWDAFFAYSQISVWNFFDESSPFRDNSYMPGFYARRTFRDGSFLFGYEHRSNGRPYFGTKPAGTDDYSRGLNYLYASWTHTCGHHSYGLEAKIGEGNNVRGCPHRFKQDMYIYYLGYLTFDYDWRCGRFGAGARLTPIYNSHLFNLTASASYRPFKRYPLSLFLQYHRGFDECLCDCYYGAAPRKSFRFGLVLR